MNRLITIVSLIFLATVFCGNLNDISTPGIVSIKNIDPFEGKIFYDLKFIDKTGSMTEENVKIYMGTKQVYTIKGNKYKSEMNGMMKITQYYLGQDTIYNQMVGVNSLMWINSKTNSDEIVSYEIEKNVEKVNGIDCDKLSIKSKHGTTQYFFNSNYAANPDDYSNHEYGFWKFCIEKTRSLPLKSISDSKGVYVEITATEIKPMTISDQEFQLPDLPRTKSPAN